MTALRTVQHDSSSNSSSSIGWGMVPLQAAVNNQAMQDMLWPWDPGTANTVCWHRSRWAARGPCSQPGCVRHTFSGRARNHGMLHVSAWAFHRM